MGERAVRDVLLLVVGRTEGSGARLFDTLLSASSKQRSGKLVAGGGGSIDASDLQMP